jgi:hypothetical protein
MGYIKLLTSQRSAHGSILTPRSTREYRPAPYGCFFDQAVAQPRFPMARKFLDGTDVEIAVMKPGLKLGHGACKKTSVLTDAVAAHRGFVLGDVVLKKLEHQAFNVGLGMK